MNQGIFWFFLVLLCHQRTTGESVPSSVTAAVKDECPSQHFNDRISKLEAKDIHQENEISDLKTTVHQLRGKVARLEAAADESPTDGVINGQAKRPSRLLPLKYFR